MRGDRHWPQSPIAAGMDPWPSTVVSEGCNALLTTCSILFALPPRTFMLESARGAFTVNHLTGRAGLCGTAEWDCRTPASASFFDDLCKVFGGSSLGPDVTGGLNRLQQSHCSVTDYAIDFQTKARLSLCIWIATSRSDGW